MEKHSQLPDPVTIVLMGATGAGKTTFMNLASNSSMPVGFGLESCTAEVQFAPPFMLDGRMVTLIDTPGFDDTLKSEAEILRMIADFLAVTYKQDRKLNGIIYLHRISDYRMGGVARKNFRLFRKLCGDDTLKNVVIATNMWGDVKPEIAEAREAELVSSELFFKPALERGAQMARHLNTTESTHDIVRKIMGFPPEVLQIQKETVDEGKTLAQTAAGRDLQQELELQAAKHREEMQGLRSEMEALLYSRDLKRVEELRELNGVLSEVRTQLTRVEDESRKIREEHEEIKREHERRMTEMLETMRLREEELKNLREVAEEQRKRMEENALQNRRMEETMKQREEELERLRKEAQEQSARVAESAKHNMRMEEAMNQRTGELSVLREHSKRQNDRIANMEVTLHAMQDWQRTARSSTPDSYDEEPEGGHWGCVLQ